MSGVLPYLWDGPDTCEVSANVTGGQLVAPDGANPGKVMPAGAGATNCLGVALTDARPKGSAPTDLINLDWPSPHTSVANNVDIHVTYAATAAYGDLLVCAANGQVAPVAAAAATPTADDVTNTRAIVGRCTEPGGVTGAGVVARARIRV